MLKNKIKDWTKCNLEPVGPLKAKILEELQSIDRKAECQRFLSEADLAKRLELKDLFERKVREEEIKWKQRSRCRWLKEGDKNTKFSHSLASTRMRDNRINHLMVNGNRVQDREGITNHIIGFFGNLFSKNERCKPSLDNLQNPTISEENAKWLEEEFKEEEVKTAIFSLASEKAPGPDGFPISFYQKH